MRPHEGSGPRPAVPRRGRPSLALTTVALVLAVSCDAGSPASTESPGTTTEAPAAAGVPEHLADGSALPDPPEEVEDAVEGPVVAALAVDATHPLVETCLTREQDAASPEPFQGAPAGAYLSPFGGGVQFEVTASVAGEPPQRAMLACDVLWRSGEPVARGGGVHPWADDDALRRAGGNLSYASLEGTPSTVAFLSVPHPDGTAWLLHDHDDLVVAYPVADGLPVRISVPVEQTPDELTVSVVFLDEDGERLGAEEVTGTVAG